MISEHSSNPWKVVKLKDIASQIQYGYTAKAKGTEAGPRFLRITDIQDDNVDWSTVPSCDIPTKDKEKYLLSEGDIVFARTGATVGKSYLIRGNVPESVFASYLIRVRLQREVDPKYINYFFRSSSYWRQISESSAGIGQPNVNGSKLAGLQIPLAPPEDQKQIVAEIEKQFSRLDEAVTALKRIQANLKRYKAAVLKVAVEGKLTEQWRKDHPDVEPADQLLKRILAERRAKWEAEELSKMKAKGIKPKDDSWKKKYKKPAGPESANLPELPEGWVWVSLESISDVIDPNPSHRMPKYVPKGIPLISSENFVSPVEIDFSKGKQVADETFQEQRNRYKVEPGDFAFSRIGTIGKTMFLPIDKEYCLSHALVLIKAIGPELSRKYLKTALSSDAVLIQAREGVQSVGVPDLGMAKMRSFQIPLPPCIEQLAVVDEIDRRLSVTEELESTIKANLKRAERLRQTILQRAFAGGII